jgi:hypothetical protein
MGKPRFRRLWAFVGHASTLAWLWSIGGGSVATVIFRQVTSLSLGWQLLLGFGVGCLTLAGIGTFTPLGRPQTETAAPVRAGSGFDPSKWAVTWGGFLVRSDYEAGHEWIEEGRRILLWLRPAPGEPIDPAMACEVKTPSREARTSATVSQTGGPTAPGQAERNGVPNADYLVEYPAAFDAPPPSDDGVYEVMWHSGSTSVRGDSFTVKDGMPVG